jgi:thiol:disulfide interchange protein DsbC
VRVALLASLLIVIATPVAAQSPASAKPADVRAEVATKLGVTADAVKPSAVPGLYEVADGADVGYVSHDGRFYIDGDVYELDSKKNLTEKRRGEARVALMKAQPDAQAIVFGPKDAKYTITVFTDVDCSYCRKLHNEMAELNKLGIRVRYLMYPRNGPGTPAWKTAEAVWCSPDRRDALTRAKRGDEVEAKPCPNPVAKHYELGKDIGLRGTPAIVTANGTYIGGYVPAARLAERLRAEAAGEQ